MSVIVHAMGLTLLNTSDWASALLVMSLW